MNKFRPILQGNPSEREKRLLSSSRLDVPPRDAKKRALKVFGVSSAVVATAQITGASTATAAHAATATASGTAATAASGVVAATSATTGFAVALIKGLAVGAVAGTIAYGSLTAHREQQQSKAAAAERAHLQTTTAARTQIERTALSERYEEAAPATVAAREPGPPTTEAIPAPGVVAATATVAPVATPPAMVVARKPPSLINAGPEPMRSHKSLASGGEAQTAQASGVARTIDSAQEQRFSSLRSERAAIELAQALLHRGSPAAALQQLAELQRQVQRPQLAPEALLVRIEALLKLGRASDAQRLGSQFLLSQPDGPYAQRVRSLLSLPAAR